MALGIPTIATAIGANYRIIDNKINGFLIDIKDFNEWETAIEKLLIDPDLRKRIGEEGRKTIVKKYSVAANKSTYRHILNSF
jgi:glycosyltransferase involved in cell wall biosynthesis